MTTATAALGEETVGADEAKATQEFIAFLKSASSRKYPTGVMPRFNQGRAAGCVDAEFVVPDGLPADLRVGLFSRPGVYTSRIRFANATSASDTDRDVRGMSIKVSGVGGDNLTAGESHQDFILNSHPVMMVGRTKTFLELLRAVDKGGAEPALFFLTHPRAAAIALRSRHHTSSHLEIRYWSTTPYLFGPGRAVKYSARPVSSTKTALPDPLTGTYLEERLAAQLTREGVSFDFLVQFQTDARRMPIEDASIEWDEKESPFRKVAEIRVPVQVVEPDSAACDQMAFNPWHALPDHRPLGDFNRARRDIYWAMAEFRAQRR